MSKTTQYFLIGFVAGIAGPKIYGAIIGGMSKG